MSFRDRLVDLAQSVLHSESVVRHRFPDVDPVVLHIFSRVRAFTMTSPDRVFAFCEAVRYVERSAIPGAIVECGVWRGGSSMAAALMLLALGGAKRDLYLFDTFEGMAAPTEVDRRARDGDAAERLLNTSRRDEKIWCQSPLHEVRSNLASTGYPAERVSFVQGKVEDTLPGAAPETISILRLDTDWYESTRHELNELFPRLSPGGVLIIDDYGAWEGARKAVDEFVAESGVSILLNRIDETGRIGIKAAAA